MQNIGRWSLVGERDNCECYANIQQGKEIENRDTQVEMVLIYVLSCS